MNELNKEIYWNQWLAGVIDGDGYLAIQKNGVAICEITMPLADEYLLAKIKEKLGGKIYLRSGAQAVRYRLKHQAGISQLIQRINGLIINSKRVPQLQALCQKWNIPFIEAKPLSAESAYMAGFFDADGTIYMSVTSTFCSEYATQKGILGKINRLYYSRDANQVCISISNKFLSNIEIFQTTFQFGTIRKIQQKKKLWYLWEIKTQQDILLFLDYVRKYSLRSTKLKRFFLIERYFELKQMKAHLAPPETNLNKVWFIFSQNWYLG